MTALTTLSTALVVGWFLVPQLAGLRFGWRGVAVATVIYGMVVPLVALLFDATALYLAGSPILLLPMALFVVGLNIAIFALLKTLGELFRPKKDAAS